MLQPKRFHQLFLDDGAIHSSERITRRLHQPKKCGPLITGGVQSRNSPQWNPDKQVWEWWYSGGLRYATSADGEHWYLPHLGLYEWEGSRQNNLAADPASDGSERAYHHPAGRRRSRSAAAIQRPAGDLGPAAGAVPGRLQVDADRRPGDSQQRRVAVHLGPVQPPVPGDGQAGNRMGALGIPFDERPRLRGVQRAEADLPLRRDRPRELPAAGCAGSSRTRPT